MHVDEVLTTHIEGLAPLNSPVMIVALTGWFDASAAATSALDWLLRDRVAPIVASIDPDPFYDFTQERPDVWIDDDEVRQVRWPSNDFRIARFPGGAHIFAKTDAEVAYGLAWAEAEDDFASLQQVVLPTKGLMGKVLGKAGAAGWLPGAILSAWLQMVCGCRLPGYSSRGPLGNPGPMRRRVN